MAAQRVREWFLLENTLVVFKKDYFHPGGNYITERLFKRHITKYVYGVREFEGLPYKNLKHSHRHLNPYSDLMMREYKSFKDQSRIIVYDSERFYGLQ